MFRPIPAACWGYHPKEILQEPEYNLQPFAGKYQKMAGRDALRKGTKAPETEEMDFLS